MINIKKTSKFLTISTIGILILLFSTSVQATAAVRPISDFTDTNDSVAAWSDPTTGLMLFPHGFFVYPMVLELPQPENIADCMPSGTVIERDLKDGSILYQVDLHVKGAFIVIGLGYYPIFVGEMDYHFQTTMILYEGELGGQVPNILAIWFPDWVGLEEPIGKSTFSHFTGEGTGTFLDEAVAVQFGFTLGESVNLKVNQVGILKPEDHPTYDGIDFEHWPVEILFFH